MHAPISSTVTAEQEAELIQAAQAGDIQAKETLLAAQERYLTKLAHKLVQGVRAAQAGDLIQAGRVALLEALQTFNPERGARLFTHAQRAIYRAMVDELSLVTSAATVPSTAVQDFLHAKAQTLTNVRVRESGEEVLTHEPLTPAQMREWATSPERGHHRMSGDAFDTLYMLLENRRDSDGSGDQEGRPGVRQQRAQDLTTPDGVDGLLDKLVIWEALETLEPRRREVVERAYGFATGSPQTDAEIAEALGVSRPRVTQLRQDGIRKLTEVLPSGCL